MKTNSRSFFYNSRILFIVVPALMYVGCSVPMNRKSDAILGSEQQEARPRSSDCPISTDVKLNIADQSQSKIDHHTALALIKNGSLTSEQKSKLLTHLGLPPTTFQVQFKDFAWKTGEIVATAALSQGVGMFLNYMFSDALTADKYPSTDREKFLGQMKSERKFLKIKNKMTDAEFFKAVSDKNNLAQLAHSIESLDPRRSSLSILIEIYILQAKYNLFLTNELRAVEEALESANAIPVSA